MLILGTKMHKKDLGSLGEVMVMQQALSHGCAVFVEQGDNSKIDLIVCDSTSKLHRVQVKVVNRLDDPTVTKLYLYKNGPNGYHVKYKSSDMDWFAVVDITKTEIAWIPSSVCDTHETVFSLRHIPKLNSGGCESNNWIDYVTFPFGDSTIDQYIVSDDALNASRQRKGIGERNDPLVRKVLESDIDFSRLGWVKQVAVLLGKREQKINAWMKKYMAEFYEQQCYKRNE